MKPSVNSLAKKELTLFDTTPSGQRVRAEREDEPGDERPKPGDGIPGEATDGRHAAKLRILGGDTEGDWSWKPGRDKLLGEDMVTFLGVPKGMPEQLGRAREMAGEPGAIRYGNPVLPLCKPDRFLPSVLGAGFFDTRSGVVSNNPTHHARLAEIERQIDFERLYSA
jgi:hypothetical protein